jgi:hypothetical protein
VISVSVPTKAITGANDSRDRRNPPKLTELH